MLHFFAKRLKELHEIERDEKGFTLIELLVVILIIGILAAIAIPAFLGQRQRAQDTEAKTAVRQAATAMETYFTDNQTYANADAAALQGIEQSLATGAGTTLALNPVPTASTYKLTVTAQTGNTFSIEKDANGTVTRSCVRASTKGGCPANLRW